MGVSEAHSRLALDGIYLSNVHLAAGDRAYAVSEGAITSCRDRTLPVEQDRDGQIPKTHSISAGLDYPGVGPELSWLKDTGRAEFIAVTDEQTLEALQLLARKEGLISALEPAHAIYGGMQV